MSKGQAIPEQTAHGQKSDQWWGHWSPQDSSLKCSAWKGFKKLWSKKILSPKKNFKKILGLKKNFGLKKNWGPKWILGPKNFSEKYFGSKKNLGSEK